MKTAAKVFIIIGMVCQCFLIFPLILGIFSLKKLKTATAKSDLTAWAIITLLFVNLIGGILMLLIPETDFAPAQEPEVAQVEAE